MLIAWCSSYKVGYKVCYTNHTGGSEQERSKAFFVYKDREQMFRLCDVPLKQPIVDD
jgi:hypothetical protein